MKKHFLTVIAATAIGVGVVLGSAACSNVSADVSHGTDEGDGSVFSIESGDSYTDTEDAAADIAAAVLPDLPADARSIKSATSGDDRFVSWKGGVISDESCKTDGSAKAPSMPDFVLRKTTPGGEVLTCDFGKQAAAGEYTYFWTTTK